MVNVYSPESLGIKPPAGGFQQGGWYEGRHYWNGTFADPGVLHPQSGQPGAGQVVSPEVNKASAAAQGVSYPQFQSYLQQQTEKSASIVPTASYTPGGYTSQAGQPAMPSGTAETGTIMPELAQPTINLPEIYKGLYQDSGIDKLEDEYSQKEKEFIKAKAEINDNPFLSEATRVGRVAKLEQLFSERTANLKGEIATKKADIETQLNLQLKQFDIQSEQTRLAWDQFNSLLSMGALDNATGEDIANITRSTGISSSMIYSAIKSAKKKNVNTELIQVDDGTNIKAILVDRDTGNVLNTSILSASKPKAAKTPSESEQRQLIINDLAQEAGRGATWDSLYRLGLGLIDPEEIYGIYLAYGIYNPGEEERKQDLAKYGIRSSYYSSAEE